MHPHKKISRNEGIIFLRKGGEIHFLLTDLLSDRQGRIAQKATFWDEGDGKGFGKGRPQVAWAPYVKLLSSSANDIIVINTG